ncbi:MAG: archaellin/type IV pilin N-terminal domain-containing protein [Nitrososphaera sp.]
MSGLKTFKNKTSRARKAISPVIATVILVAVAVVIAAALAGFSSSLFGTYSSQGAAMTVKTISVSAATSEVTVNLLNSGNTADELVSVQIPPNAPQNIATGTVVILPGAESGDQTIAVPGTFAEGDTESVKLTFKSGLQLTQSVIVGA